MISLKIKFIAALVIAAALFYSGIRVERAFNAERDLAIKKASDAFILKFQMAEAAQAKLLEDKLSALKANERLVIRETQKIVNNPIYRNECFDADGVHAIERARRGETNSSKYADKVPATD